MTIRERLARWLAPDMARDAEKYFYLWNQVDDAHKWLSYEFKEAGDVLLWIKMTEQDHWRALGTPARNPWPSRIDYFRERMRAIRGVTS